MVDLPARAAPAIAALDGPALAVVEGYLRELAERGASRSLVRQRGWALREAVRFAALLAGSGPAAGAGRAAQAPPPPPPGLPSVPTVRALSPEPTGPALPPVPASPVPASPVPASPEPVPPEPVPPKAPIPVVVSVPAEAVARVRLGELAAPGFAEAWLASADPVLRGVADPVPATQRARIASLRALARHAGLDLPGHEHGKPALRAVLTVPQVAMALPALSHRLPGRGPDDQVRLAAVLAVMSVWPARSVELSALRLAQVRDDGVDVVLDVSAEGGDPPVLRGVAAGRMREWIAVRAGLVAGLQGGRVHALWTSIRSNSRPAAGRSLPLPAGMPLRPRGLQRAYARSVVAANDLHAGRPGFPLPPSLDLLRRSLLASGPLGDSRPRPPGDSRPRPPGDSQPRPCGDS